MRKRTFAGFLGFGVVAVVARQLFKDLTTPARPRNSTNEWFGQVWGNIIDLQIVLKKDFLLIDPNSVVEIKTLTKKLLKNLNNPDLEMDETAQRFLHFARLDCQHIFDSLEAQDEVRVRIAIENLQYDFDEFDSKLQNRSSQATAR